MDAIQEKTKSEPEHKGVLVHAIVVAAWKLMRKAGSIGVVYHPQQDEFEISATYLGKKSWYLLQRLVFLSDPDAAMEKACASIRENLGMRDNDADQ